MKKVFIRSFDCTLASNTGKILRQRAVSVPVSKKIYHGFEKAACQFMGQIGFPLKGLDIFSGCWSGRNRIFRFKDSGNLLFMTGRT